MVMYAAAGAGAGMAPLGLERDRALGLGWSCSGCKATGNPDIGTTGGRSEG